jgi:hypothetical protein
MAFTLVLTRHPDNVFTYNTGVADTAANRKKFWFPVETGRYGTLVLFNGAKITGVKLLKDTNQGGSVDVPGGRLEITSSGDFAEIGRYTTIERLDHHIVSLHKQPVPYGITYEPHNPVVMELGPTHGNCFRVHGGHSQQERGILIHAAPHVGWLTGCISPRKLGDYNFPTQSTYDAISELKGKITDKWSELYVTDS